MAGSPKSRKGLAKLKKLNEDEITDLIHRHASGESIRSIRESMDLPIRSWYRWLKENPWIQEALEDVRRVRANELPWEALDLVDNAAVEDMPKVREQSRVRMWIAERVATQFKPKVEVNAKVDIIHQHLEALKASNAEFVIDAEIIEEGD